MFAVAAGPSYTGSPLSNLFFAIQPEPDLEFTEEELEQTTETRSSSPKKSPKKSGGRPLLWIVLLALVGGGAYVAMEPEMVLDWVNQLLGETAVQEPQPTAAAKPAAPMSAPAAPGAAAPAPVAAPPQAAPTQAAPPTAAPQAATSPAPAPAPTAVAPAVPTTPPAPSAAPKGPIAAPPPAVAVPAPMFGEGQRVTVVLDPATAGDTLTFSQDAAGTKPGFTVRPGTLLTILDGDLQPTGWVYSVRSDDGAKGWVAEKRLRLKP